jgi:Protein of unknown function (DUF4229)
LGDNHRVKRFSPFVVYTSARLALFIVTATVLALLGMQGIGLLMVALVVSGLLSYVLLSRLRDAVSEVVVGRARTGPGKGTWRGLSGLRQRLEERTTAEDAADDARRAAEEAAAEQAAGEDSATS